MTTPISTSEPNRLSEEQGEQVSSLERALLNAGSSYKSSPQTRAKVLAGLGLAAGSSALLAGSAAASVSSAAKISWVKLLFGISLVGAPAVPVGYYALHRASAPAGGSARSSVTSVQTAPASEQAAAAPEVAPAPAPAMAGPMLSAELSALDHARLTLVGGDARRALDELDGYDRRFPAG